jgi:DNA-binding beta-propeller fold protein YncE
VLSVSLPAGQVTATVPVGEYAHDATALADGTIAAADEHAGELVVVRSGRVVHRYTDLTQPGGVTAAGTRVAVIDVAEHQLSLYETRSPRRVARVAAGDGPTHLVTDRRGRLVVVDTRGERVLLFATEPRLRQVGSARLRGTPYGLAYDATRDRLWVTLTARNQVVGMDLAGDRPTELARLPTVRQPNTVAVDAATGRVFVASRTDGTVQLVDPPA